MTCLTLIYYLIVATVSQGPPVKEHSNIKCLSLNSYLSTDVFQRQKHP